MKPSNNSNIEKNDDKSSSSYDAIVIGAGISGLYQLYKLRSLGFKVLVLEAGTGVGGTWYWNRYPGARFDSESYSYGYSFSKELLDEWDWKEHFSGQPEIEKYCNFVADKFHLKDNIRFSSRVAFAHYQKSNKHWTIGTSDGMKFSAQFLITAIGLLSAPTMPNFNGIKDFRGSWTHTGLWPKEGIDYHGKRVAVIGTGASGVQAIQDISKTAKSLTVFQRRPNWCTPLHNGPISKIEMEEIRAGYPALFQHCKETAACFVHTIDPRGTFEVTEEERLAFYEDRYAGKGFGIWQGNFRDMLTDERANKLMSDFVADKIRRRVNDPEVAEMLIPKDHGFGTRRVPQETFYYEVYNQPHVKLISMLEDPIEKITETGIKTSLNEFEFDVIIYATGFDAVTGAFNRIDIRDGDGVPLESKWTKGPRTFIGMMVDDFPNMFMIMGPHAALGNNPRSIEYNVEWISNIIDFIRDKNLTTAEAPITAVDDWHEFVSTKAEGLLSNEVDSWMTGINLNVKGKQTRTIVRYTGTAPEYRARCDEVAKNNFEELTLY
ncbi:MAG: NAD(P)/FAD-dependent oxidoreductase [Rhodospirillaceae bacterium]|nr:NAD(P)/FAD-dependent oxidoreductase [Rhodospirillaceae bacterium]MBT6307127.1 NAD(P)/FAD-dependent oxidoreductase [Rhodospirillaceae bacterium]MBT7732970.1 NAD(P)/FAD-dependent oxidoreductase [Rhodospirillaceae bacterium]MDC0999072.1 NAD(P)/FAD-dependent oxidoreductase [Alphaproteobacteria bacterium]MDC1442405.1 NAD(P)/FAD-dependent oxidoreductase [Rhodospirillaceae bacterium]